MNAQYEYCWVLSSPCYDTWTPVTNGNVHHYGPGEGVLDGILYVVSGRAYTYNQEVFRSVESYHPSAGVWTFVVDMNVCRELLVTFILFTENS